MDATKIFSATTFAAVVAFSALAAAVGAHAGEAYQAPNIPDYAQNGPAFHSTRQVTDVRAEALKAPSNIALQTAGAGVTTLVHSGIDRATVRKETAIALRAGQIPHGEASMM